MRSETVFKLLKHVSCKFKNSSRVINTYKLVLEDSGKFKGFESKNILEFDGTFNVPTECCIVSFLHATFWYFVLNDVVEKTTSSFLHL